MSLVWSSLETTGILRSCPKYEARLYCAPTQNVSMAIDSVFRALSDPTRLHVLERLSKRPASVSELAAPYDMALPSFVQHLRILQECGLVRSTKIGRVR